MTKAFAIVADIDTNQDDHTLMDVALYYFIVGDPGSTLNNTRAILWVRGLGPDSATLSQDLSTALKTYLTTNGVTFGVLDTVHLEW